MEDCLMDVRQRNEQYTWIPAFKAIADWIVDYEDKQEELVNILAKTGITKGLEDEYIEEEKKEALKEIDPFTFFAAFMKFGVKNREKLISKLINVIGKDISLPKDFDGVPTAQALKFWLFPYKYIRSDDSIPLLWELFRQARNGDIKEQDFNSALKILGTGFTKLTQYLFYINPSQYLPIDAQTEPWLEQQGFTLPQESWSDYQNLLEKLKVKTDMPFWQISYEAWYKNTDKKVASQQSGYNIKTKSREPNMANLNRILYGPPGTGKTYCTTELAVQCVAPDWYESLSNDKFKRQKIKDKYDELTAKGRVAFTTFHQSFSYEDFVEGIRPVVVEGNDNNSNISYEVVDGVFKQLCTNAITTEQTGSTQTVNIEGKNIWKLSLGNTNISDENEIFNECIDNNYVLLGWGDDIDFSNCSNRREVVAKIEQSHNISLADDPSNYKATAVNIFKNAVSIGDLVIISNGNHKFRAIAEITDDYEFLDTKERYGFQQLRKVKWLRIYSPSLPKERLFDKSLSQMAIYQLRDTTIDREKLKHLLTPEPTTNSRELPHLIIIDEINRGNISRIFGELITLLEPDKRKGGTDAREVILPYSKLPFSVPSNLYILGTMNTADKSLAQLDLALRRRFDFVELLPQPKLLDGIKVHGIAVSKILTVMNQRIEVLLDREHVIGHSYFWSLKDLDSDDEREIELGNIFKRRIIPLLQEYFFSDWERIGWVLNDPSKHTSEQFVQTREITPTVSELFHSSITGLNDRRYHINKTAFNNPESYKKILIQTESKILDSEA
ncbi:MULTISPECIES: AAA family ATPase [Psychrobacter]|uniref:AAA family ATPase n=1 Tax=Psychrobacter TaxID=497 RepID=UPI00209462B2|nr:AAA family ATPase [Psychrobacter sp. PSP]